MGGRQGHPARQIKASRSSPSVRFQLSVLSPCIPLSLSITRLPLPVPSSPHLVPTWPPGYKYIHKFLSASQISVYSSIILNAPARPRARSTLHHRLFISIMWGRQSLFPASVVDPLLKDLLTPYASQMFTPTSNKSGLESLTSTSLSINSPSKSPHFDGRPFFSTNAYPPPILLCASVTCNNCSTQVPHGIPL